MYQTIAEDAADGIQSGVRQRATRTVVTFATLLLVYIAGASLAPSRRSGAPSPVSLASLSSVERKVSVYKRTYSSSQPLLDGNFLRETVGLDIETEQMVYDNSTGSESICARREVLKALDGFEVHLFESMVTDGHGVITEWIESWKAANYAAFESSDDWSAFALPSLTFYSPWIVPFLENLDHRGTEHARYYRLSDDGDTMLYSVLIAMPYSGLTIEIISDQNIDPATNREYDFKAMSGNMCPTSFTLRQQVDTLQSAWSELGGSHSNARGLPDVIVVSMGFPTLHETGMNHYLNTVFSQSDVMLQSETYGRSDYCSIVETELATTASTASGKLIVTPVYLKNVRNSLASPGLGDYTIGKLTTAITEYHARNMGTANGGWDAFLDMHPGIHSNVAMDEVVNQMAKAGYEYTMHPDCNLCSSGSVWSSAATPWAMEIQGTFDNSSTIGEQSLIDYCSSTSSGDTSTNVNMISRRS